MLGEAIRHYMMGKGLRPTDLTAGLNAPHMSSVSRVLRGVTRDPRTSTLVHVCRLIEVDPTQLLIRAGMWATPAGNSPSPPDEPPDARLTGETLHRRARALPQDLREVWGAQTESLLQSLETLAQSRSSM